MTCDCGRYYSDLRKYSKVNQAMLMVSMRLSQGFSTMEPSLAWYCSAGRVLITIPTMETNTKLRLITDTT